jgi:hypothetical protein
MMYPIHVCRSYHIQADLDQKGRAGAVSLDLQLPNPLRVASPLLSLQHACHARALVSQHERSGKYGHGHTILNSYICLVYTMLAGHCADCAPLSFSLQVGRPLHCSFLSVLGGQPPAVFHLPPDTHGRTVAHSPSHLW